MNTKLIAQSNSSTLNLTVSVSGVDANTLNAIDAIEAVLTAHVVDCRHCLAMALYREETLAETGCEEYKILLEQMETLQQDMMSCEGDHIDDAIVEDYCFNLLSSADCNRLENHVAECSACADKVKHGWEFVWLIKSAVKPQHLLRAQEGVHPLARMHAHVG